MAAARRIKQQLFEERKKAEEEAEAPPESTRSRKLVVYTWGAAIRKACSVATGHNFNVSGVSYRKQVADLDLSKVTGMDEELKAKIAKAPRFELYVQSIVKVVERDDLTVISINCRKGRHRSVSVANILKDRYYPQATVIHLELGKKY